MAGWDHEFDVDPRDIELARDCFRVWRRTCARYFVEFTYRRASVLPSGRVRYLLAYDARTVAVPPAVAEFAVEMRAVSMVQPVVRRKRLPLRLLREIARVNLPSSVDDELDHALVPDPVRLQVRTLLTNARSALLAFDRGEMPPADILDTLHSSVLNLSLLIAPGATTGDSYPTLVDKLNLPQADSAAMKELGRYRNSVKHRGKRDQAGQVVPEMLAATWAVIYRKTGVYLESVSPAVMELAEDDSAAFRLPPMYTRFGAPRVTRR